MPMYNGNYVAPVWIDGMAPAINDTELMAISGTLQNSQILTGNGAPTQYTSGVAGQRYADTSTTPPTIYKLVTAAEDANVWEADEDANGNLALDYDETATYDEGDYCIRLGLLYRANQDIDPAEAWTSAHWDRAYLAADVANLAEAVAAKANPPAVGSVTLSDTWTGSASADRRRRDGRGLQPAKSLVQQRHFRGRWILAKQQLHRAGNGRRRLVRRWGRWDADYGDSPERGRVRLSRRGRQRLCTDILHGRKRSKRLRAWEQLLADGRFYYQRAGRQHHHGAGRNNGGGRTSG